MALFTTKGIADCLNLTERRVRELRDEGVLTEERPGIFNLKTVVRQYVAYKTGGTKDDQSRLAAARADREETRGEIEKMKMEEAKGDLHRTEDVERGLKAIFAISRTVWKPSRPSTPRPWRSSQTRWRLTTSCKKRWRKPSLS